MKSRKVSIPTGKDDNVSGVLSIPDEFQPSKTVGVILAHGSGNDMETPLIVAAAAGELPVQGLVFLGYPLHAPGKKDRPRDAHLYHIDVPMLFVAGTRDSLCDLALLQAVLKRLKAPRHLEIIKGGDHSFNLVKSENISPEQIYNHITEEVANWLSIHF